MILKINYKDVKFIETQEFYIDETFNSDDLKLITSFLEHLYYVDSVILYPDD